MLFLYGVPGTGKSKFTETLRAAFGDYAGSISGSRVARESSHLQWLAGLQDKRLVVINELPQRGQWQTDSLNDFVSGETVEANKMRQDSINFKGVAHVIATGNHRPSAGGGSGIWRRMRIIQFQNIPAEIDTHLSEKLLAELPGVLAWMLQGLDMWLENGRKLDIPAILTQDTEEYQSMADPIKQFADDCLILDPAQAATVSDLYTAFTNWYVDNVGEKVPGKRTLGTRLDELGWPKSVSNNVNRLRQGVGITRYVLVTS